MKPCFLLFCVYFVPPYFFFMALVKKEILNLILLFFPLIFSEIYQVVELWVFVLTTVFLFAFNHFPCFSSFSRTYCLHLRYTHACQICLFSLCLLLYYYFLKSFFIFISVTTSCFIFQVFFCNVKPLLSS